MPLQLFSLKGLKHLDVENLWTVHSTLRMEDFQVLFQRVREWDRYMRSSSLSRFPHIISLFCRSITSVTNSQYSIYGHSTTKLKKGLLKPLETPLFEFTEAEVSSGLRVISVKSRGCVPDSCAATSKIHQMFRKCLISSTSLIGALAFVIAREVASLQCSILYFSWYTR